MEPMDTLKKTGIMAKLRNRKGFSLVEMAIVLVIIGIIIGAIIKGQDLITNSRAKQVAAAASTWRNLAMAYLDRNGRLPGSDKTTGIIAIASGYSSATKEISRNMPTAPTNPVTVGGSAFYMYFGNTTGDATGRNVIVICSEATCTDAFSADQLEIIKSVDNNIDGVADANQGQFRGATTAVADPSATTPSGFAVTAAPVNATTAGAATAETIPWDPSTGYKAAIWAFDRPF